MFSFRRVVLMIFLEICLLEVIKTDEDDISNGNILFYYFITYTVYELV